MSRVKKRSPILKKIIVNFFKAHSTLFNDCLDIVQLKYQSIMGKKRKVFHVSSVPRQKKNNSQQAKNGNRSKSIVTRYVSGKKENNINAKQKNTET